MKTLVAALAALACLPAMAQAQTPISVRGLFRQADFVGIVQASPSSSSAQGEWRQSISLTDADGVKGILSRDYGNNQYPYVEADHAGVAGYPTRFGERGEYLVFLHRARAGAGGRLTTLAAFHVQYYPDGLGGMFGMKGGSIVGLLASGQALAPPPARPVVAIAEARQWLTALALGQPLARRDEARLDTFLRASLLSAGDAQSRTTPTHEERMALAQKLAGAVTPGMTRADVEKIFPQPDGGLVSSGQGRYYFGSEVMVNVPFDANGGPFQPENRVNGPLRVYRDSMHYD